MAVDTPAGSDRPEDPFVRGRRPDPATPPESEVTLAGLLGDSDRPSRRRLYLNTRLDYYVEFRSDDVVRVESIRPEEPPFPGLDATRVHLVRDATVDWVRRRSLNRPDEFLLRARLASDETVQPDVLKTWGADCPEVTHRFGHSDFDVCRPGRGGGGTGTFGPLPTPTRNFGATCATCDQGSCDTCATCDTCWTCGRTGCGATCAATCVTCGRATCGDTCQTCATCGRDTCVSCWQTCQGTCVSCEGSCQVTCSPTRADTCNTCDTCAGWCLPTVETCHTCGCFTQPDTVCFISCEC